jgi:ribonuclease III
MNDDERARRVLRLERIIDVTFYRKDLALQALTTRGYLAECQEPHPVGDNERFEFLGDSIIQVAMTVTLLKRYPHASSEELTRLRIALVKGMVLGKIGYELGLFDILFLMKGAYTSARRRSRSTVCGKAFEAIIGAIFTDQGMGKAWEVCLEIMEPRIPSLTRDVRADRTSLPAQST